MPQELPGWTAGQKAGTSFRRRMLENEANTNENRGWEYSLCVRMLA